MDDPAVVEAMKVKVYAQLRTLVAITLAKEFPYGIEHEVRRRKQAAIFRELYDGGPESREALFKAILTPEERAVAKAMRAPAKRGLRLPWLHRGARIL